MTHPTKDQYLFGYRIEFGDGGKPEAQILHKGTLEECEEMCRLLPGVVYSGPRPDPRAYFVIAPIPAEAS